MANQYKRHLKQVQQRARAVEVFFYFLSYLFMLSESLFHQQFALGIGSKLKKNIFLVTKSFMGHRRGVPQIDRHRANHMMVSTTCQDLWCSYGWAKIR